ncbi:MAG: tetratricopeptide repeat protein [Candidatus Marinimicrobia bacterium]|nr:tetratricopeptide repeat protein [Candidatus Neomarinimicrobiota bacterium]
MKRLILFIVIITVVLAPLAVVGQLTVEKAEQENDRDVDWQNIKDSLQLVYQEKLNRKVDSLKQTYQKKQDQFLDQLEERRKVNYEYIQNLQDSLKFFKERLAKFQFRNSVRDSAYEARYFEYIERLLDYKDKKRRSILGVSIGGRAINEFKIEVLKNYLDLYSPRGKSEYVQYYLTQVYYNQKMYAKAEHSFLKYLYFYTDSPSYSDMKHEQLKLILENGYFKERSSHIVKIMDNIDEDLSFQNRYYNFIKEIRTYPNQDLNEYFLPEVENFLNLFPDSRNSARLLALLSEHYQKRGKVQYAFLTLEQIIHLFPQFPEAGQAMFKRAEIRAEEFEEYDQALSDYNRFIEENPESEMVPKAHFQIAMLLENYLEKYDMALEKYQEFAQNYPNSEFTARAMVRSAAIVEEKIKDKEEAVSIYLDIAEKYKGSPTGKKARTKAANLYYEIGQYKNSIDQFMQLYRSYPMEKESIEYLFKAADIYEKKLNDIDMAIETLTYITENFPASKQANEAQKRIDELSQESGE